MTYEDQRLTNDIETDANFVETETDAGGDGVEVRKRSIDTSLRHGEPPPSFVSQVSRRSLSIVGEGTFCEWLKTIFTMKDEDIEDVYGEDALQYLRFQRYVIGYLMFVMVICISVILPLNFMGGLQGML